MDQQSTVEPNQSLIARYEALLKLSRAISTHHNVKDLILTLKTELTRVARFDGMVIGENHPETRTVTWHFAEMLGKPIADLPHSTDGEELAQVVYERQEPVVIRSVSSETRFPRTLPLMMKSRVESLCIMPLTTARRRIGSLGLASLLPDIYGEEDVRFLASVADQTALAIDAALTFEEIEAVRERLQLLLSINNSVVSNLELRDLFKAVSSTILSTLRCDGIGLQLPHPETAKLETYAMDFPTSKLLVNQRLPLPPVMQQVFDSGVPAMFCSTDEGFGNWVLRAEGINVAYHIPLRGGGRNLGVLSVCRRELIPFTPADMKLMSEIGVQVSIAIQNALAYQETQRLRDQLARENVYLENEIRSELNFEEIVGRSEALAKVLRKVETVAPTDSTVVIYGDTGTGKELIARALHSLSSRCKKPFVKLNCAAIPAGLLESELFGHEKGAFTGAVSQRIGRFELASQGTVFLDEIGELPMELQPKLLRVLQEGEFERLGSSYTIRTNARLITATNRDLLKMVNEQRFRADLYYRLNVFPLQVPPLRDRREDIPLLVRHFVQHYARRMNRTIETIPSETINVLSQYSWPGNIRELQNLIERAVILSSGPVLNVPVGDLQAQNANEPALLQTKTLEQSDREHILEALRQADWVIAGPRGAAARLGLKRSTLQARMAKLGIRRARSAQ